MYPRTHKGEKSYQLKKRRLEIQIIISAIENQIKKKSSGFNHSLNILEFGCGNGFQIPYLQKLGVVTATDIIIPQNLNRIKQANFVECDISNSPFLDHQFDLVFSNHVIEHIRDLSRALEELKRIGKRNCLYALSVPTNVWLLLSIPAQYLQKMRALLQRLNDSANNAHLSEQNFGGGHVSNHKNRNLFSILFDKVKPHGHGRIRKFWKCYQSFKKDAWLSLFNKHGFEVLLTQSLLLYAPSEWPIIPIISAKGRDKICSSLLYLIVQR